MWDSVYVSSDWRGYPLLRGRKPGSTSLKKQKDVIGKKANVAILSKIEPWVFFIVVRDPGPFLTGDACGSGVGLSPLAYWDGSAWEM